MQGFLALLAARQKLSPLLSRTIIHWIGFLLICRRNNLRRGQSSQVLSRPRIRRRHEWNLHRPFRRQRLGLLQNILHRSILQVGRIAVLAEQALHVPPDVRTGGSSRCIQSMLTFPLITVTSSCAIEA